MTPEEFEKWVANRYESKGYETQLTPSSHDYGVDIFAEKEGESIAIQVKMYGQGSRKIVRKMIFELFGAQHFFGCTGAVIAATGEITPDALEACKKLGIEYLQFDATDVTLIENSKAQAISFDSIWETYVMPLQGKKLQRKNGSTNTILKVDWSGLTRLTSGGNEQFIDIEIFQFAINKILCEGSITRKEINQQYVKRASSGIVLVLAEIPLFELDRSRPMSVKYKPE